MRGGKDERRCPYLCHFIDHDPLELFTRSIALMVLGVGGGVLGTFDQRDQEIQLGMIIFRPDDFLEAFHRPTGTPGQEAVDIVTRTGDIERRPFNIVLEIGQGDINQGRTCRGERRQGVFDQSVDRGGLGVGVVAEDFPVPRRPAHPRGLSGQAAPHTCSRPL